MRRPPAKKFVYAIASPAARHVKIGVSVAPSLRVKDLQHAHGSRLTLVAFYPAPDYRSALSEKGIHKRLASHRLVGEWFKRCPEVLAIVEEMRAEEARHAAGIESPAFCYACKQPVIRPKEA